MASPSQTVAPPAKSGSPTSFSELPVAAKVFVAVLIVMLLAGGYYFGLHMDLADQIAAAEARHTQLVSDRQAAERRQQEFVRVSQQLVEREPIDRRNRRILPENAEIPAFLGDMNRLAELSGLTITLVQPQPESQQPQYVRVPVAMKLTGQFHQFAKFFHAVSQLDRVVSIQNLKVEVKPPAGAATSRGGNARATVPVVELRVEFEASTFRRPAPAAAGGGAAAGRGAAARRRTAAPAAGGMR